MIHNRNEAESMKFWRLKILMSPNKLNKNKVKNILEIKNKISDTEKRKEELLRFFTFRSVCWDIRFKG